jgi:hypothetical protein
VDQLRFISGVLAGAGWGALNFLLLIKLFRIALLKQPKTKLPLFLLIKFPILYLIGFLLLVCKWFPVYSLLLGFGLVLLVTGVINLWPKRK